MAHIIREWSWIVVFHCFINLKLGKSLIAKSPTKKVPPNPKKQSLSESNVMKMSGHFGWFQIMFHWSHDLKSPKTPEPALALDSETFVLQVLQETNTEPKLQLFCFKEIMITVCQSKGYGKNHPKNQVKKPSLPSALDAVRTEPSQKVLQRLTPWFDNKDEASSYRMVKNKGRKPSGYLVERNISRWSKQHHWKRPLDWIVFLVSKKSYTQETLKYLCNTPLVSIFPGIPKPTKWILQETWKTIKSISFFWEGKGVKKEPWPMYVSVCRYKKWINKT